MLKTKRKRKKQRKIKDKKLQKPTFSEFARSELDEVKIREASLYWEKVRKNYMPFESDFKGL